MLAGGRWVSLFGDDSEVVGSGPGAALGAGFFLSEHWKVQAEFAYAYHPSATKDPALQAMSLESEVLRGLPTGAFRVYVGGGVGVLAMGTEDRYDHWGFVLRATAALGWPSRGRGSIRAGLRPSLVFTADGTSFYLPLSVSGEFRW
jgi:hypothetical protein